MFLCVRLSVHSPSDRGFQQERRKITQLCTYYVLYLKTKNSAKLLALEVWAHLKECVLFFSYSSAVWYKLSSQDSNVMLTSSGSHHGQHWGTLLWFIKDKKKINKFKKTKKIKPASSLGGMELKDCVGVLSMWIRIHSSFWSICLLYFCLFCFYTHIKIIFYCTVLFCCKHH